MSGNAVEEKVSEWPSEDLTPEPERPKHIGKADMLVVKGVIREASVEQIREIKNFCSAILSQRE